MSILQESYDFLQQKLLPQVRKKHWKLFTFGFEALTIKPFVSLNGNARTTLENRKTAETKIYRVMHTSTFVSLFPQLVAALSLVKKRDTINVDFSTFCGYQVLTFAKQTSLGRAIPIYFGIIEYPIASKGSQTIFIQETIQQLIDLLGFAPHLVFDRGFESPYLVPFLVKEKIPFTARFRKDKHVLYCNKEIPLYNLPWFASDTQVEVYAGVTLRAIRSEQKPLLEEPWYLVTNDYKAAREAIIARYYFRFEIEETFKDIKYIFDLKQFYRIKTRQTFTILLWFYVLSVWLSFFLEETKEYLVQRVKQKKRKKLSVVRCFAEAIQLELFSCWKQQFF